MWARVTRRPVSADRLETTLKAYQDVMFPYVSSQSGNIGTLVLVDRDNADILTISMWADRASMDGIVKNRPKDVSEAAGNAGTEQVYEIFAKK